VEGGVPNYLSLRQETMGNSALIEHFDGA